MRGYTENMGKVMDRIVNAERVEDLIAVFGSFDENIKRIEESLNVSIVNRGTDLRVTGDEEAVDKAARTLEGLLSLAAKGETIDEQRVRYLITLVREGNDENSREDNFENNNYDFENLCEFFDFFRFSNGNESKKDGQ